MKGILGILDTIWNIKFLTGYRSALARTFLVGVSAYQWIATADVITKNLINLPDVPNEFYVALVAYFSLKLEQFASEHKP